MADADKDYYSFEEVLRDLDMEEDQLKKLVSAGEIRAFRDKNTMRFKAEDIARLRGGEDADLELDDDLDLDLDDDLDLDLDDDQGGGELELADDEPLLDLDDAGDDLCDELVLEDDHSLGGSLGGDVEEVDLGGDSGSRAGRGGRGAAAGAAGGAAARKELRSKRKVGAEARAAADAQEQASEGPLVMGLLCVGAVVLLLACFTVFSAVAGHSNPTNGWIVNFFS